MAAQNSYSPPPSNASSSDAPQTKRKRASPSKPASNGKAHLIDLTEEDDNAPASKGKQPKVASPRKRQKGEEKRMRIFRSRPPQSYLEKLNRVMGQRMFVINRTRGGTEAIPEEVIEMAGSTGNIYTVSINQLPSCTCPDHQKGNQCKHIVYVLHNVLKAPRHLQYQLAFVSAELREIFTLAPAPPSSTVTSEADLKSPSNRKEVSGDCPICFTEFEPETEEIVWCKAACGNNIHKGCFEQWATSQKGKEVRCIYCRTPWQGDEDSLKTIKSIKDKGLVNEEGYVNVAEHLGLSGAR
ncbi:hypothetical protein MMC24_007862, partial [Lignoscripta atroalba]|nr:hypothetical protein [Lignoscripta atroalba]